MRNTLSIFSPAFEDDFLETIGAGLGLASKFAPTIPRVDIKQTDDAYALEMELPGIDESNVDISLHDRTLTISSKQEESNEKTSAEDGVEYLVHERRNSSFSRRFTLPEDSDCDKINAQFTKGILEIIIPRRPDTKPRTISITSK